MAIRVRHYITLPEERGLGVDETPTGTAWREVVTVLALAQASALS
jgi:hypothetical protein